MVGSDSLISSNESKKTTGKRALMIVGVFLVLALIPAGIYLVQQRQEVRKEAAGEYCGPDNGYNCPPGEHCLRGGQPFDQSTGLSGTCGVVGGGSCRGWCNKDGCGNDCPNIWPVSFYCRGRSHSACGQLHSSFLGFGIPAGSIRYSETIDVKDKSGNTIQISPWCTTVQADANVSNAAIVVYIGDRGEYCVEGTGCNPDALDWDCSREPPLTCSSLTRSPGGDIVPGTTITLTCAHSGDSWHHYNFRYRSSFHQDWQYGAPMSGFQNNTTGSTSYVVPSGTEGASYIFQCQACRENDVCTAWGQAQ